MGRRGVTWGLLPLLIFAIFSPESVHGQDVSGSEVAFGGSWTLRVGLVRHGLSDELASPLRHRGTGLFLGAGYGAPDHRGGWSVDATYWGPRVGSDIATDAGGFEDTRQVDLGVVWLRPVTVVAAGRLAFHLGGALDARFSLRSHHYGTWGIGSKVERFGDLFVPLQLAGMWSAPLGGRSLLTHRISVPVMTLAFRSPYTGLKYFPKATLEGPGSVTGFDSRLTYRKRAGSGWLVGLFHHMTLVRYPEPRALSSIVHRVGVEVTR